MNHRSRRVVQHGRVNLSKSHPALFHSIMVLSVASVALAFNFWLSRPVFNPYGWDKRIVGTVFAILGVSQLVFLNLVRDLRMVRLTLAVSISWMFFWGVSNSQQSFAGDASFQLPILYVTGAILQIPLLIEAPVNPMTEKE